MRAFKMLIASACGALLCACATPSAVSSNPTGAPLGPYSQVVEANGFVFFSGIVAASPQTGALSGGDIQAQSRQVLANLDALLVASNLSRADVVKTTMFLRDAADMRAMNAEYAEFFGDLRPARTTVPGADWGGSGILIEIEVIAVRR